MQLPDDLNATITSLGLDPAFVVHMAQRALAEDLDGGVDVTTAALVPSAAVVHADFRMRVDGVVAGIVIAKAILLEACEGEVRFVDFMRDGAQARAGEVIFTAIGPAQGLLTGERSALNFLGRLSGIATATRAWTNVLAGSQTHVRDTRKTTPGLRAFEKFAVRMGGGVNHRMSLSDAAMIKDNHIVAAGSITAAHLALKLRFPDVPVEIEIDSLSQLEEAVATGAELILLDNMTPEMCDLAVRQIAGRAKSEASGGITLENARKYAEVGVDYIAVGALTHSVMNIDIGVDFRSADAARN
ncbi:MAG: carboxylating nicotinate-nucleotide diphosphorylase [Actinobacteria bacterium]|uniref:nicotinate-nucleotide diphosphorylase (carboxylating) n=1 Tax=freshwater metagenome TaxID=449393 RepID=A0A6J7STA7_9ZZZZ|nr:carboxylating nicotinate-nucleotide diphosphorylase [Actinomycetota bacterium]MSY88262.1 carboxylating nicotinate-nucleotide diphosphorylase [Actinomycetota bacterium]MTB13587.1 carboxylating nicotinate-nucleotide diphosphorylase [Actinomycetota bacterium]